MLQAKESRAKAGKVAPAPTLSEYEQQQEQTDVAKLTQELLQLVGGV